VFKVFEDQPSSWQQAKKSVNKTRGIGIFNRGTTTSVSAPGEKPVRVRANAFKGVPMIGKSTGAKFK